MSTFTYHGRELNRFDHLYNSTAISERGVEVAVAVDFLAWRWEPPILEVGNVLKHYEPEAVVPGRRVVDLYEHGWGVDNIDVFDIEGEYESIVSISTLEHVGFDYEPRIPNAGGPLYAVAYLRELLTSSGVLLVTFGIGFNPELDAHLGELEADATRYTYLNRKAQHGWASEWYERDFPGLTDYGTVTPWANTVWIGEFGPIKPE